ncbi:hypothetical protein [Chromobacterium violaceum]|uniref:hypothetical protein n=1 Tax=Chromobacterium violaceum TaxID=536 RepID=UPI001CE127F2|nr:hypothetical protein [Chromobacterium violaceum]
MQKITDYQAPSIEDLAKLKNDLGYTGEQMAELAGLAGNNQWRKYTGGAQPREMGMHMLFFIAAKLTLTNEELERVFKKMRLIGAKLKESEK